MLFALCALIPLFLARVSRASPSRLSQTPPPPPHDATGHLLRLDGESGQAAFSVPCPGCLGAGDDADALFFDFQAYPSSQPCGTSNLSLNGEALAQHWTDTSASGRGSFTQDFHDVELSWESNCLFNDAAASPHGSSSRNGTDTAQVLTVRVESVDHRIPLSLSGFTVSYNQYPEPRLLKLSLAPISPAPAHPSEDWRISNGNFLHTPAPSPATHIVPEESLDEAVQRLKLLQNQQKELQDLIRIQRSIVREQSRLVRFQRRPHRHREGEVGSETEDCESLLCKLREASHSIHDRLSQGFARPPYRPAAGGQRPTMIEHASHPHHGSVIPHVERPPPAHIYPTTKEGYSTLPDDLEPGPPPPKFRRQRRNAIIAAIHFILVILGLAAIYAFLRRRFSSLRTRTERAANREERRSRKAYKRAARRAAWKNWWRSGWGRRKDAERKLDYEEKRALVLQGEGRLEDAMQNEIRELRRAHDMVDELVRAEEGRGNAQRPVLVGNRQPGMASIAGVMMGREHIPAHYRYPGSISSDDDTLINTPPSSAGRPRSRSNSLPAYQTDPDTDTESRYSSDNPPSYRTDDDTDSDSDADSTPVPQTRRSRGVADIVVTNGFTQYAPSEYTPSLLSPTDSASIFTPDSSIPDVSPRESAETVRTFM